MESRFLEPVDQCILSALFAVFNPGSYPSDEDKLATYGNEEIDQLELHYADILPEASECAGEYERFKRLVHSHFKKITTCVADLCELVITKHSESFPGLKALASIAITLPVSSVDCERGFSRQNLIKSRTRSCLKNISLHRLLMISIEGPPLEQFDFQKALKVWTEAKTRRIFQVC